jgi:hypothetical protein
MSSSSSIIHFWVGGGPLKYRLWLTPAVRCQVMSFSVRNDMMPILRDAYPSASPPVIEFLCIFWDLRHLFADKQRSRHSVAVLSDCFVTKSFLARFFKSPGKTSNRAGGPDDLAAKEGRKEYCSVAGGPCSAVHSQAPDVTKYVFRCSVSVHKLCIHTQFMWLLIYSRKWYIGLWKMPQRGW